MSIKYMLITYFQPILVNFVVWKSGGGGGEGGSPPGSSTYAHKGELLYISYQQMSPLHFLSGQTGRNYI